MLEKICRDRLKLTEDEIEIIKKIDSTLSYTANLVNSDIFIDCFYKGGEKCYVVAEAKPNNKESIYDGSVIGELVTEEKEPAVFMVLKTGMPAQNIRAITQENKIVRQDVVPIRNSKAEIFAVLIREKDVSENIHAEKKYQELVHESEKLNEQLMQYNGNVTPFTPSIIENHVTMKEIHHRVKNNLQFIASLLNIQSRRIIDINTKQIFKDNVNRILSIASVYDILTQEGLDDKIYIKEMINKLINIIISYTNIDDKDIDISIEGKDMAIDSDKATSIAVVMNELLSNIYEHAFVGRDGGKITISVSPDILYSSIVIRDDGIGFNIYDVDKKSLGLELVRLTLEDKLGGKLQISSGDHGSIMKFVFKN